MIDEYLYKMVSPLYSWWIDKDGYKAVITYQRENGKEVDYDCLDDRTHKGWHMADELEVFYKRFNKRIKPTGEVLQW